MGGSGQTPSHPAGMLNSKSETVNVIDYMNILTVYHMAHMRTHTHSLTNTVSGIGRELVADVTGTLLSTRHLEAGPRGIHQVVVDVVDQVL